MAIAHVATEYVFSDFLLKEPPDGGSRGVRVELSVDKLTTFISVGLPLLFISLAFAQEVSVGTQISCFPPSSFSIRQAAYVDSFCWAAVQQNHVTAGETQHLPLWPHKYFPYMLLLVAIFMYIPSVIWRFTAAPHLFSDLNFMMEELDRTYNRAIKRAEALVSGKEPGGDNQSSSESCFRYPLVGPYLKTKRSTRNLVAKYLFCRVLTLVTLVSACFYLGYYISLASTTDEFTCDIRTGHLRNGSEVPSVFQCKLVAVGVFWLLSSINLLVYVLLAPLVVYAAVTPLRQGAAFLCPYEALPDFGELDLTPPFCNDLGVYLCFLEENLGELKSHRCLLVLTRLQEEASGSGLDVECLLRTLGQVKMDGLDSRSPAGLKAKDDSPLKRNDVSSAVLEDGLLKDQKGVEEKAVRQRTLQQP
ncbi:pannexin-1-like [Arapaima gigas]